MNTDLHGSEAEASVGDFRGALCHLLDTASGGFFHAAGEMGLGDGRRDG